MILDLAFVKKTLFVSAVLSSCVLIGWGLINASNVLLIIFAGVLFGIFLQSLTNLIQRRLNWPHGWSLASVTIALLLILIASGWLLFPTIGEQIQELQKLLPESFANLRERLQTTAWGNWLLELMPEGEERSIPKNTILRVTGWVGSVLGVLGIPLIIIFAGLMFAAQPDVYVAGLLKIIPQSKRSKANSLINELGTTLQEWLVAKLISMTIIGFCTWLGLLLIGVKLAVTLAIVAALLTFIPNFGPVLAAVPAILLAFLEGPSAALWVFILYVVVQLFESYLITPLLQYRALSLPPGLILSFQLVASACLGIWGLALATPLLAVLVVLVKRLYIEDYLKHDHFQQTPFGDSDNQRDA